MNGIELASRFSFITNQLHFCGPGTAAKEFLQYMKKKDNTENVRRALQRFEGLYPYLSTIAEKLGKDFLDYDVVEAYWIGNKHLEQFNDDDMKKIIKKLISRGLPKSIGEKLIAHLPYGFFPHHDFNVFYVGVGRTTGSVETTLQNMNNCRTSWGKILEIHGTQLIVASQSVLQQKGKYVLGKEETKTAVFIPEFLPKIKRGDIVALHWGFAPVVLTTE
ncbi:MAG: DUF6390 family protein, partial [Nanoarchaeota archaeon]